MLYYCHHQQIQIDDTINSMPDILIDTLGGSHEGIAEVSEYAEVGKVVGFISVRDPDSGDNGKTSCHLNSPEFELVKLDDDGKYKVGAQDAGGCGCNCGHCCGCGFCCCCSYC